MLIMTTTLTATSMSTAEQRLRLMQLASSNLPVGGYSWSCGLEWAVEAGWVWTSRPSSAGSDAR